jgi:hypothetical protein
MLVTKSVSWGCNDMLLLLAGILWQSGKILLEKLK